MRKALRGAVEFALVASGLPALGRQRRRGDTLVLAYHNVVPDGAEAFGDRSLHLPLSRLRQQLAALEATHEVVSLDELETPARTERPRAAITFDDAYAGANRRAPERERSGCEAKRRERLRLVTQTLLVAILLHALAALVLGDFRLPAFFQ